MCMHLHACIHTYSCTRRHTHTHTHTHIHKSCTRVFVFSGTITSSSPSAGPADVLIEGIAPHRRARSAAWSFNFYPHEAWVDLIITLPCAVLLKEVHIQPHLASLSSKSTLHARINCSEWSCVVCCSSLHLVHILKVQLSYLCCFRNFESSIAKKLFLEQFILVTWPKVVWH